MHWNAPMTISTAQRTKRASNKKKTKTARRPATAWSRKSARPTVAICESCAKLWISFSPCSGSRTFLAFSIVILAVSFQTRYELLPFFQHSIPFLLHVIYVLVRIGDGVHIFHPSRLSHGSALYTNEFLHSSLLGVGHRRGYWRVQVRDISVGARTQVAHQIQRVSSQARWVLAAHWLSGYSVAQVLRWGHEYWPE